MCSNTGVRKLWQKRRQQRCIMGDKSRPNRIRRLRQNQQLQQRQIQRAIRSATTTGATTNTQINQWQYNFQFTRNISSSQSSTNTNQIKCPQYFSLTMTDLVLHTVLHGQENYHLFRFKFLIKRFTEMKSRGAEYFKINIPLSSSVDVDFVTINFIKTLWSMKHAQTRKKPQIMSTMSWYVDNGIDIEVTNSGYRGTDHMDRETCPFSGPFR